MFDRNDVQRLYTSREQSRLFIRPARTYGRKYVAGFFFVLFCQTTCAPRRTARLYTIYTGGLVYIGCPAKIYTHARSRPRRKIAFLFVFYDSLGHDYNF